MVDEIAGGKLRTLFLPEGSTEKDLKIFSSLIRISHKELTKTPILLKFEPSTDYPSKGKKLRIGVPSLLPNGLCLHKNGKPIAYGF